MNKLFESEIEEIALRLLRDENGYSIAYGPDLLEGAHPERTFTDVILKARLRAAIDRLNPLILEEPILSKLINGEIEVKVIDEEDFI